MSTINLLPEDYIEGRRRRRMNLLCLALFAVVVTGVLGATIVSRQSAGYTEEIDMRVQSEYEDAARLIQQMQQLQDEKERLHQKALATTPLIERVPRSTLLAVVAGSLPPHASLVRFDLETKKQQSESSGQSNTAANNKKTSKFAKVSSGRSAKSLPVVVTLKITGLASTDVDVARFIANMARNPLLKSVDLVYSQQKALEKDKPLVREFQVKAELEQAADAIQVTGGKYTASPSGEQPLANASLGVER